jgi:hypothetical protein
MILRLHNLVLSFNSSIGCFWIDVTSFKLITYWLEVMVTLHLVMFQYTTRVSMFPVRLNTAVVGSLGKLAI